VGREAVHAYERSARPQIWCSGWRVTAGIQVVIVAVILKAILSDYAASNARFA
jgi:hypothetical protein